MKAQRAEITGVAADRSSALLDYVYRRAQSFVEHVEKKHFLGFGDSTLASLFMSHVRQEPDGYTVFEFLADVMMENREHTLSHLVMDLLRVVLEVAMQKERSRQD